MKKFLLLSMSIGVASLLFGQSYPEPEFSNEVYFLKKDTGFSLVRLEKNMSKMVQTAGFGGSEFGYSIDGDRSPVRLKAGQQLTFVFFNGTTDAISNKRSDSVMRANGIDPSMVQGMNPYSDPANSITLYKATATGGNRKIYLQKTGPALPFSSHKPTSSDKYTLSIKKVRDGYWVLVVDKTLPQGEYVFTIMNMAAGTGGMQGGVTYAFGVD